MDIFLSIGSNLPPREKNCERAILLLSEYPKIRIKVVSSWHATKAQTLPGEKHPDFLNGAVRLKTALRETELLEICKGIEKKMGRKPSLKKWQPRPIDLDILFYGDKIIKTEALTIPHPLLHERLFVLKPLREIAPNLFHPVLKKSISQLLEDVLGRAQ